MLKSLPPNFPEFGSGLSRGESMPRTCTICRHPNRNQIDMALVQNGPLRAISDQWSVSKTALLRHRNKCLPTHLLKAKALSDVKSATSLAKEVQQREESEIQSATSLVAELRELAKKTGAVLSRAMSEKNGDLALKAIARLERQLELKARLLGELEERGSTTSQRIEVVYVDKAVILPAAPAPRGLLAKGDDVVVTV